MSNLKPNAWRPLCVTLALLAAGIDCLGRALGPMNVPSAAGAGEASYPLERAAAAQEENRNGGTQGKIVLIVDAANAGMQ